MNGTQKGFIAIGAVVCLALALLAGWGIGSRGSAGAVNGADALTGPGRYGTEGLRVSGTAIVRASPDVATVRFGYLGMASSAGEAKRANDEVMKKAIAAMVKQGVARKDIQTVEYQLSSETSTQPTGRYTQTTWKRALPGGGYRKVTRYTSDSVTRRIWSLQHTVEVRVRKVDTVEKVIDAAEQAGADQVGDVRFSVDSLHKLRTQAREMAGKVAREKGEQLARLLGAKLGRAVSVTDSSARDYGSPWYYGYGGYREPSAVNRAAQATSEAPGTDATPDSVVSGGQITVEAREEVTFALE